MKNEDYMFEYPLKKGTKVIMADCYESTLPEYANKVWTCLSDSFMNKGNLEVVFLDGFAGYFYTKYLRRLQPGKCYKCGCTEINCIECIKKTGNPCHWVNEDKTLCSACEEYDYL